MQTDELQAGRELDALVAERVMGWPVYRAKRSKTTDQWVAGPIINQWQYLVLGDELRFYDRTNEGLLGKRWHPSEDITAAWEVADKISFRQDSTLGCFSVRCYGWIGECWEAGWIDQPAGDVIARAKTAPLAICRAALRAVGLEEGEEAGWVTEPGWRYCDGKYSHVCKPNQAPVVVCDWLIGFIGCPKCSETLSFVEARRLAEECES